MKSTFPQGEKRSGEIGVVGELRTAPRLASEHRPAALRLEKEERMMNREQLLKCLRETAQLPFANRKGIKERTIYEGGDRNGRGSSEYFVDFASYPGGSTEQVPRSLIDQLESEGVLIRAFPNAPAVNGWVLNRDKEITAL